MRRFVDWQLSFGLGLILEAEHTSLEPPHRARVAAKRAAYYRTEVVIATIALWLRDSQDTL